MDRKQRFFIHDRREAIVLFLLAIMVAVFAFTLGIHLGKKVSASRKAMNSPVASPLAAAPEASPEVETGSAEEKSAQAIAQPSPATGPLSEKEPGAGSDETLTKSLHDEVARTGVKLDQPRQVELPENAKSENGGATTEESPAPSPAPESTGEASAPAAPSAPTEEASTQGAAPQAPVAKTYALQVASYATLAEARTRIHALGKRGVKAYIRTAKIAGKGIRHRVMIGGFASHDQAQKAGDSLHAKGIIGSFIISRQSGE
jgi:cell division septation protein DedD